MSLRDDLLATTLFEDHGGCLDLTAKDSGGTVRLKFGPLGDLHEVRVSSAARVVDGQPSEELKAALDDAREALREVERAARDAEAAAMEAREAADELERLIDEAE